MRAAAPRHRQRGGGIGVDAEQSRRQRGGVGLWHQQAGIAVADQFGNAGDGGGDRRALIGQRLDHHVGDAFLPAVGADHAGRDADAGLAIRRLYDLERLHPVETGTVGKTQIGGLAA